MFTIVPAIEIDATPFATPPIPYSGLNAVTDVLPQVADLAEYLAHENPDEPCFIGGYAFLQDGRYAFGAERDYRLHRGFNWAFEKIADTSVVPVAYDDHSCKFIRLGDRLDVHSSHYDGVLSMPWTDFRRRAADAMKLNADFKRQLGSRLQGVMPSHNRAISECLGLEDRRPA